MSFLPSFDSCLFKLCFEAANGLAAIQLAKLSGLTVIATASPKHNDYLKSLGADYVLPYSDPSTPSKIKEITKGKLYLGYDAISEKESTALIIESFGSSSEIPTGKKKEVAVVLPVKREELGKAAMDVVLHLVLSYTMLGKEITLRIHGIDTTTPASPEDYQFSLHHYDILERLIKEKKLGHQKLRVLGGLEKVQEGFEYMKAGRVSAEKLIYHPWDTKF